MEMSNKLTPEQEVIAAHMAATTAAFQVLVTCLQDNGSLRHGEFQEALRVYAEALPLQASPAMVTLLDDLRRALIE